MSSGGGTTTQVTQTELPSWLQDAAQSNLARADYVSQLGYVPQYGLDVAGFTPMQQSAMQNTADAASAFGLSAPTNAMAGMPAQQTNNLGFSGYSSGALYDDALAQLAQNRPAQYEAINSMFIDPTSGDANTMFTPYGSVASEVAPASVQSMVDYSSSDSGVSGQKGDYYDFISSAPVEWLSKNFGEPTAAQAITSPVMSILGSLARNRVEDYYMNDYQPVGNQQTVIPVNAGGSWSDYESYNPSTSASSSSRQSSALDSGTGSGIGAGGGNAAGGYSFGGW